MGLTLRVFLFATLMSGFLAIVKGQCGGSEKIISVGTGVEQSPNYLPEKNSEYGKPANCSWSFNPPSGADYALMMTVQKLRLYAVKNGGKHCLGSYNLTLDDVQFECPLYVDIGNDKGTVTDTTFCIAYYESLSCSNISEIQRCNDSHQTSFPVAMSYYSDGRKDPGVTSAVMHFEIAYKFFECPKDSINNAVDSTTEGIPIDESATTTFSSEDSETTRSKATIATSFGIVSTASTIHSENSETTATKTTTTAVSGKSSAQQDMTVIIAASAGGGGFVLLIIVLLVYCCKKRQQTHLYETKQSAGTDEVNESRQTEQNLKPRNEPATNETDDVNINQPEADVYDKMGGASEIHQSKTDVCDKLGGALETNQSPSTSTSVITEGEPELYSVVSGPKSKKTAQAHQPPMGVAIGESNQSQPELYSTVSKPTQVTKPKQPRDDYTLMSSISKSTSGLAVGEGTADSQQQSDMYSTISTPGKSSQSIDPEEAYMLMAGNSEEATYTTVAKPPKVAQLAQPVEEGALYSAVSITGRGEKETVHYSKNTMQ